MAKAFITGVEGLVLSSAESRLLAAAKPAGLILFARNCQRADQIRALVAAFKAAVGSERVLILIDQEGGRVQRLKPPLADLLPPAAAYASHFAGDLAGATQAARLVARHVAAELRALDINTDCAPVLDLPVAGAHDIIGNRAFATDVDAVIALGQAFAEGLMAGAVLPVMKHIPGHGRAGADSHLELPIVTASREALTARDFAPFTALSALPAAMTAHVVYSACDPSRPASTSRTVTTEIIRGRCGFDGLLMSDDLGMKALAGSFEARTAAVLEAGSDVALHCSGDLAEMTAVAAAAPVLAGEALVRFERALAITHRQPDPYDRDAAQGLLEQLVSRVV